MEGWVSYGGQAVSQALDQDGLEVGADEPGYRTPEGLVPAC
jgi:hypothetical protein